MQTSVLLIDDDEELAALLREYLTQEGFRVECAHDGNAGLARMAAMNPDIVVLDVMMPGKNGIEVLSELRRESSLPVLMLTARGDDTDRIIGLELGADDYLPKPCNPRELVARIRAVMRRTQGSGSNRTHRVADLSINSGTRKATLNGDTLELTSTEFSLLQILLEHAGSIVKKGDLYRLALGRDPVRYDRAVDMHMSNLRRKLGPQEDGSERIETVRGLGYQYILRESG